MSTPCKCLDCGTTVAITSKRCLSCAAKHRWSDPTYKKKMFALKAKQSAQMRAQMANPSSAIRQAISSPESRAKHSACARAQWDDPNSNIRHAVTSPEFRAKVSTSMLAVWKDPKKRRNLLEGSAKRERCRASIPELLVKEFLEANFDEVIWQYVADESMSPGVYDFFVPSIDVIIEVDGSYWHSRDSDQKKDKEKEEWALKHDYGFVRIKESDMKNPGYFGPLLKELLFRI